MSRRGGPGVQVLAVVAVVGLFMYGFYSYHQLNTHFRKTEEKADHLRQQHDSISAQLQGNSNLKILITCGKEFRVRIAVAS